MSSLDNPASPSPDGHSGVRGIPFWNGPLAACLLCGTALAATWDTGLLEETERKPSQKRSRQSWSNSLEDDLGGEGPEGS